MRQDVRGKLDQFADIYLLGPPGPVRTEHRGVFERSHAACPGIAESFDGIKGIGASPLHGQPGIDQGVAELVGERVGEQAGESVKRLSSQCREGIDATGQRHGQRCNLDAAANEGRIVFKGGNLRPVIQGNRTDGAPPEFDFGDRVHDSSPQDHRLCGC